MWTIKSNVRCPVCGAILGKFLADKPSEYPCRECQWIFPFDVNGKGLPPVKMNPRKPQVCTCESCKARTDIDVSKYIGDI